MMGRLLACHGNRPQAAGEKGADGPFPALASIGGFCLLADFVSQLVGRPFVGEP